MANHTKPEIVVIGSNMIDLLSKIERLPIMGETLIGSHFHLGFGGKGANQAVMASRLGAKVAMVTKVGNDLFGPLTMENFSRQGISTEFVSIAADCSSGVAPILVDEAGRNMIIIIPGANMLLDNSDINKALNQIRNAKLIISQLEIPDAVIEHGFEIAQSAGVRTILNPAPAREIPSAILRNTHIIVPNETEAEKLTGIPVTGVAGAEEASKKLLQQGPAMVITTLGEDGALLCDRNGTRHFPAPRVAAVDSTGAGDAFIGGLAFALTNDYSINEAIEFANKCAALSVTKMGTQLSFPTLEEVINAYRS